MTKRLSFLLAITIACLFCNGARAQYTEFFVSFGGNNKWSGWGSNEAGIFSVTGANFTNSTGTVRCPDSTDLSALTNGMFVSLITNAETITTFVAAITNVNDAGDFFQVSRAQKSGFVPGDTVSTLEAYVGPWRGPTNNIQHPVGFFTTQLTNSSGHLARLNIRHMGSPYNITSTLTCSSNGPYVIEGYTNAPGDLMSTPQLYFPHATFYGTMTALVFDFVTNSGTDVTWRGLWFDRNGTNTPGGTLGLRAFNITGVSARLRRVRVTNVEGAGFRVAGGGSELIECETYNFNLDEHADYGGFRVEEESRYINCIAHDSNFGADCEGWTFLSSSVEDVVLIGCIAENVQGSGFHSTGTGTSITMYGCAAVNCGSDGVFAQMTALGAGTIFNIYNSVFVNITNYGVRGVSHRSAPFLQNCAFYNNAAGQTLNINAEFIKDSVTLTGDPFTDAANGNFYPNNTAGAGAALRNAGIGRYLLGTTNYSAITISYPNIGPVTHTNAAAAAASSGGSFTFAQ